MGVFGAGHTGQETAIAKSARQVPAPFVFRSAEKAVCPK